MIRLRFIAALLVVIVAWVMCGCTSRIEESVDAVQHTNYSIDGYFSVTDFRLRDGTRCVAVGGNTGRGITCNWHKGVE